MARSKWITRVGLLAVPAAVAAGCAPAAQDQVIAGTAEIGSFPGGVDTVRAVRAGQIVTSAAIGASGAFSLTIPVGKDYRIEFAKSSTAVGLAFPRATGAVGSHFSVESGGAAFQLGKVRYVGTASAQSYHFDTSADGECNDGVDATTGAMCVDDAADGGADQCDAADTGGVDCVDGIDAATGQACDGGPDANADGETADDGPSEQAVAEHNLPAALGCDGETAD